MKMSCLEDTRDFGAANKISVSVLEVFSHPYFEILYTGCDGKGRINRIGLDRKMDVYFQHNYES